MAYKAKFSAIAEIDLFEVIGELSQFYPSTPKKFKTALKKTLSNIKLNPYMYKASPYNPDYRQFAIKDYIVLYKVIDTSVNTGYIEVYRILKGSRNIEQILG